MKCACQFSDNDGSGIRMCQYHEKAFKYLAKTVRDRERTRIVQLLGVRGAQSMLQGHQDLALGLEAISKEVVEKAPITVPLLKPNKDELLR